MSELPFQVNTGKMLFIYDSKKKWTKCLSQKSNRYFSSNPPILHWPLVNRTLYFITSSPSSLYYCHIPKVTELFTKFSFELCHLRYYRFRHNFQDSRNTSWYDFFFLVFFQFYSRLLIPHSSKTWKLINQKLRTPPKLITKSF